MAQRLSVSNDVEAELSNDRLPDVVWTKDEMQVLLLSSDDAFEEAVGIGYDFGCSAFVKTLEGAVHGASARDDSIAASCEVDIRLLHLLKTVK